MKHLTPQEITDFISLTLKANDKKRVEEHLLECIMCSNEVAIHSHIANGIKKSFPEYKAPIHFAQKMMLKIEESINRKRRYATFYKTIISGFALSIMVILITVFANIIKTSTNISANDELHKQVSMFQEVKAKYSGLIFTENNIYAAAILLAFLLASSLFLTIDIRKNLREAK